MSRPTPPPAPKEWVTVKEAAVLAGREPRTIYDWIDEERLAARTERGIIHVLAKTAARLGEEVTRGRPKSTRT